MQTSSISQIKKELQTLPADRLVDLCISLAKYKKENKELFHYLLFQSGNEADYIQIIKEEVESLFQEINHKSSFFEKKGVRKILKLVQKYSKYANKSTITIELLIHFCEQLKNSIVGYEYNVSISNMYDSQLKKIQKEIEKLHEDLQYDYTLEFEKLIE